MTDDQTQDMQRVTREVQRIVTEARAEAVSENGAVRVVAGPGGQIQELSLEYSAYQMSGVELGEMIVETIKDATRKLETELSAEVERIMSAAMPSTGDEKGSR